MKYRIKEVGGLFYPQFKWFLFWSNFDDELYCTSEAFDSYIEAQNFLTNYNSH